MAPILDSSAFFLDIWLNGLYCTLMLTTLYMIVSNRKLSTGSKIRQSALIIAPYICSTVYMSTIWMLARSTINDNESPAGPGVLSTISHPPPWETGLSLTAFAINIILADYVVIWRCWVVWARRWTVVILPILCTIAGAVVAGFAIADQIIASLNQEPLYAAQKGREFVRLSTVCFSLSITTSLIIALLIAGRVYMVQRHTGKAGIDSRNSLNSTIEIVIESAVIYSVTLLAFIIVLTGQDHNPTTQTFTEGIHAQIAGIAPLLIIYRVASKQARSDTEWEASTAMDFAARNATSTELTEIGSTGGGIKISLRKPGPGLTSREKLHSPVDSSRSTNSPV